MPKYTYDFNFDLDVYVKSLELEADSPEEALEKLRSYSIEDLILKGYVKDFEIKDLSYLVVEDGWYDEEYEDTINYIEDKEFLLNFGNIKVIMPKHGEISDLYDVALNFISMYIESKYKILKDKFELDKFKQIIFENIIDSLEEAFNNAIE